MQNKHDYIADQLAKRLVIMQELLDEDQKAVFSILVKDRDALDMENVERHARLIVQTMGDVWADRYGGTSCPDEFPGSLKKRMGWNCG